MTEKIEKLKEFIDSKKKLHKIGNELVADMIEFEIEEAIIYFCADNDLKAGDWDFKQIISDYENGIIDGTIGMIYSQFEFDILEYFIEPCDEII